MTGERVYPQQVWRAAMVSWQLRGPRGRARVATGLVRQTVRQRRVVTDRFAAHQAVPALWHTIRYTASVAMMAHQMTQRTSVFDNQPLNIDASFDLRRRTLLESVLLWATSDDLVARCCASSTSTTDE